MGPAVLVRAAIVLLMFGAAVVTPTDADLWGHLAFGRDIVASGDPVQTDIYSFTTDRPWINHEWLSEAAFFAVYRAAGPSGLIAFKVIVIAVVLACVWTYLRSSATADLAWALTGAAFVGTFWRTHNVRPQLFSVLLFTLLLLCMRASDSGRRSRLWFVPLIACLWVNLHGGWILGLAIYGLWAVTRLFDHRVASRDRATPMIVGVIAAVATLINPWGLAMWSFLGDTVRPGRADIEEWSSITQYPLVLGLPWIITLAAAGIALWRSGLHARRDYVAIVTVLAVLAFLVGRLDAFFVLAVVILLAPQFARMWTLQEPAHQPSRQPGIVLVTVVTIAALLIPVGRFVAPYTTCMPISGGWAPDLQAARFITENRLTGRMLTWFDWGEYVIWHFGPGLRVSMDGRRETVYSAATIDAHQRFYRGGVPAISYAQQLNPTFIWLPTSLPVSQQLLTAGWTAIFDGSVSKIWARTGAASEKFELRLAPDMRCFPGP